MAVDCEWNRNLELRKNRKSPVHTRAGEWSRPDVRDGETSMVYLLGYTWKPKVTGGDGKEMD